MCAQGSRERGVKSIGACNLNVIIEELRLSVKVPLSADEAAKADEKPDKLAIGGSGGFQVSPLLCLTLGVLACPQAAAGLKLINPQSSTIACLD